MSDATAEGGYNGGDAPTPQEAATQFSFEIPECGKDTTLKVTAPDGVMLHIKKNADWQTFDKLFMIKGEDGKWGIKHLERMDATAQISHVTGAIERRSKESLQKDLEDVNISKVRLETTKGPIDILVQPSWAPQGALRFLQLITDGFFSDVAIYRGVPKFLVQFGVKKDPAHVYDAIQDDPLTGVPIVEGSVCFAASGPNTRTSTICLFLGEFPQLGKNPWETPIGQVHPDSMDTLRALYTGYGDIPQCGGKGPDPVTLAAKGNDYITEDFPQCDFIKSATWAQ